MQVPVFSRIVMATDFSDPADRAMEKACALATPAGVSLTVVHVLEPKPAAAAPMYEPTLPPPQLYDAPDEEARLRVRRQIEARISRELSTRAHVEILAGDPVHEIRALCEAIGADLLVIGTHGRRGAQRLILGGVAEKLMRRVSGAVLVVH